MKDRWFLPFSAILFGLIGYAACHSCQVWQATANATEIRCIGSDANRVRIIAPDATAAEEAIAATKGYSGPPITIQLIDTPKNASTLTEFGNESAQLHVWAPRAKWSKIIKIACRLPHECNGECKTLVRYRRFDL